MKKTLCKKGYLLFVLKDRRELGRGVRKLLWARDRMCNSGEAEENIVLGETTAK